MGTNVTRRSVANFTTNVTLYNGAIFACSVNGFPALHYVRRVEGSYTCRGTGIGVIYINNKFACNPLNVDRRTARSVTIVHTVPSIAIFTPNSTTRTTTYAGTVCRAPNAYCLELNENNRPGVRRGTISFAINGTVRVQRNGEITLFSANTICRRITNTTGVLRGTKVAPTICAFPSIGPVSGTLVGGYTTRFRLVTAIRRRGVINNFNDTITRIVTAIPYGTHLTLVKLRSGCSSAMNSRGCLERVCNVDTRGVFREVSRRVKVGWGTAWGSCGHRKVTLTSVLSETCGYLCWQKLFN